MYKHSEQTQHFIVSKIILHEVATCFSPSHKTNTKYIKDGNIKMKGYYLKNLFHFNNVTV